MADEAPALPESAPIQLHQDDGSSVASPSPSNGSSNGLPSSEVLKTSRSKMTPRSLRTPKNDDGRQAVAANPLLSSSLYIFPPNMKIRLIANNILASKAFEAFILLTIIGNCITLAISDPRDENAAVNDVSNTADYVFLVAYTIEMLLKIFTLGFFVHKGSYLRSGAFNLLDFFLVASSFLLFLPTASVSFTGARVLRFLRPLKAIVKIKEIRVIVNSLLSSLPKLGTVLLLFFFFLLTMAIIGMNLFRNTFKQVCVDAITGQIMDPSNLCSTFEGRGRQCPSGQICDTALDSKLGGFQSFDQIGGALLTLFIIVTLDAWTDSLTKIMQSTTHLAAVFYVLVILIGTFTIMSLALVIVNESFQNSVEREQEAMRDAESTFDFLNKGLDFTQNMLQAGIKVSQQHVQKVASVAANVVQDGIQVAGSLTKKVLDKAKPNALNLKLQLNTKEKVLTTRAKFIKIVSHPLFTIATTLIILANTAGMAYVHYGMSQQDMDALDTADIVFNVIFLAELLIKLIGMGHKAYFADPYNRLDFVCVTLSLIEIAVGGAGLFRLLRLLRVFKIARVWRSLRHLLFALVESLRSLFYFCCLVLVFLFIFSLISMQLFGGKFNFPDQDPPIPRQNFDTLGWAWLSNFASLTGENWSSVMFNAMQATSPAAALYFVLQFVVGTYLILSGFLSLLLGNMEKAREQRLLEEEEDRVRKGLPPLSARANGIDVADSVAKIAKQIELEWLRTLIRIHMLISSCGRRLTPIVTSIGNNANNWASNMEIGRKEQKPPLVDQTLLQNGAALAADGEKAQKSHPEHPLFSASSSLSHPSLELPVARPLKLPPISRPSFSPSAPVPTLSPSPAISLPPLPMGLPTLPSPIAHAPLPNSVNNGHEEDSPPPKEPVHSLSDNDDAHILEKKRSAAIPSSLAEAPRLSHSLSFLMDQISPLPSVHPIENAHEEESSKDSEPSFLPSPPHPFAVAVPKEVTPSITSSLPSSQEPKENIISFASAISEKEKEKEDESHQVIQVDAAGDSQSVAHPQQASKDGLSDSDVEELAERIWWIKIFRRNRSFGLFSDQNAFRQWTRRVVANKWVEWIVILHIILSSITLALDNPLLDEKTDPIVGIINVLDIYLAAFFALEMFLRMVSNGVILHPGSFFRSPWNMVDGGVVAISILGLIISKDSIKALRAIRLFRVLSPIRLIKRNEGVKLVLDALSSSIPGMLDVLLVAGMLMLIFAILGVSLFAGKLYNCTDPSIDTQDECVGMFSNNGQLLPRIWRRQDANFDNVGQAMFLLFRMCTQDNWPDVLFAAIDARDVGLSPQRDYNPAAALYFVVWMVLGSLIVINIFVGILCDNYSELKSAQSGFLFMTEAQKKWAEAQRLCIAIDVQRKLYPPQWPLVLKPVRGFFFKLVQHLYFEYAIGFIILINIGFMCVSLDEESGNLVDLVFTCTFGVELVLKLLGLGARQYWASKWHRFDAFVIAVSVISLVADLQLGTVFRIFRLFRILRLLRFAVGVRTILKTLVVSLPSLLNVAALIFLVFFIGACIGVQLFAKVKPTGPIDSDIFNFQDFKGAFLILLRTSTYDSWSTIAYACGKNSWPDCSPEEGNCGNPAVSALFFCSFVLVAGWCFLNLFVAVLLSLFGDQSIRDKIQITEEDVADFATAFYELDSSKSHRIHVRQVPRLLQQLDAPFGCGEKASIRDCLEVMKQLHVKASVAGVISYPHLLLPMFGRIMGEEISEEVQARVEDHLSSFMDIPDASTLKWARLDKIYSATLIQSLVRGYLVRQIVRHLVVSAVHEFKQSVSFSNLRSNNSCFMPILQAMAPSLARRVRSKRLRRSLSQQFAHSRRQSQQNLSLARELPSSEAAEAAPMPPFAK